MSKHVRRHRITAEDRQWLAGNGWQADDPSGAWEQAEAWRHPSFGHLECVTRTYWSHELPGWFLTTDDGAFEGPRPNPQEAIWPTSEAWEPDAGADEPEEDEG